jgi:TrwC relaxase
MQAVVVVTVRSRCGAGGDAAARGPEAYWLEQIARDACEYYAGKGESPGWWAGSLADRSGLEAIASEEAVHRLFAGQDPVTGEQRVAPVWRSDPARSFPPARCRRPCGNSPPPVGSRSGSWPPASGHAATSRRS